MKEAQKGGSGVVIYFRKEGRALGEVTKVKQFAVVLMDLQPLRYYQHSPPHSECSHMRIPHSYHSPSPPKIPRTHPTPPGQISVPSADLAFDSVLLMTIFLTLIQYLVYNARKRGSDRASEYFKRTENIAGVKDMRFQALMPDILHWLGIKKIDRMLSMSK